MQEQVRLDSGCPTLLCPLTPYRNSGTGFWYYTQHPWPSSEHREPQNPRQEVAQACVSSTTSAALLPHLK